MNAIMSPEVHSKGVSDGGFDCESGGTSSGNSTAVEVSANSVCMSEPEIEKGIAATGVIAVGAGNDEPGNQGAGGSLGEGDKPGDSGGNCQSAAGANKSGSRNVLADVSKEDAPAAEKDSFVIDIKPQRALGGSFEGEKICRICHLSSEQVLDTNASKVAGKGTYAASFGAELILLGCGCKDELGMAHRHCAEAWFKLKGNRFCEICGETAENVFGVGDNRFMEEWNDGRGTASTSMSSSERGGGCWRRQPFCNFLMACLVMAFVLPWFFRVNLF